MLIYIALIIILIIFSLLTLEEENYILYIASTIFLFLILGFRNENVGTDTIYYLKFFNNPQYGYHGDSVEFGYEYFQFLVKKFWDNKYFYLTINAFVSIFTLAFFIKKTSPHKILSLLLFVLVNQYYFLYFSAMRQSVAIGLFLISLYYLFKKDKNLPAFSLFYFLAFLFHTTVIWTLPIILVVRKIHFKKSYIYILLSLSFVIGVLKVLDYFSYFTLIFNTLSISGNMGERYDGYALGEKFNDYDTSTIRLIKDYFPIYLLAMIATYYARNIESPLYKLFIIGMILSQFIMSYPMSFRLVLYFVILGIVVLPKIFQNLNSKYWIYPFFIFILFYKTYLILDGQFIERSKGNIYVPYDIYID